jgi:hypothetical protein
MLEQTFRRNISFRNQGGKNQRARNNGSSNEELNNVRRNINYMKKEALEWDTGETAGWIRIGYV